jgi:hypothetical protein
MKIISFIIILIGLTIAYLSSTTILKKTTESEILTLSVNKDLQDLQTNNLLPKEWQSLKDIKINPRSKNATNWIASFKPDIKITKDGQFRLEIQIIDGTNKEDSENPYTTILAQFDLIEIKSENKIWEITRTFTIKPN